MEELLAMTGLIAIGGGLGTLITLFVQSVGARNAARRGAAPPPAPLAAIEASALERVVTALDRFDRRLEAVEQRMEFSEKLLLQPSSGAGARPGGKGE